MSVTQPDKNRRLLPRWQSSRRSIAAGELISVGRAEPDKLDDVHFEERKREWEETLSLEVGAELLGSAIVLNRTKEVETAARAIADAKSDTTLTLREMALRVLGATKELPKLNVVQTQLDKARIYAGISRLRGRLQEYPRSALEWVDLARLYTIIGQNEKAKRSIKIALYLTPEDRFVLRCAARFFVHIERADRALSLLQRAQATKQDPWLMAPEIAIAHVADLPSKTMRLARKELKRKIWSPRNRSELEGALGTFFLEGGSTGQARQMFHNSLEDPTENAIAQAQWAAERAQLEIAEKYLKLPTAHEARALHYRITGKWDRVIENCWQWAGYEPTSIRSMLMGSYAAAIAFEDGRTIIQFSSLGRDTEPHNTTLLNNLAVGFAYTGELEKAWETLGQVIVEEAPDLAQPALYATTGLLLFRTGDIEQGRAFYERAIAHPYSQKDSRVRAVALWHLVREEAHAKTKEFPLVFSRAQQATEKMKFPEIEAIRSRLPKR